jgi:hypothetical protein
MYHHESFAFRPELPTASLYYYSQPEIVWTHVSITDFLRLFRSRALLLILFFPHNMLCYCNACTYKYFYVICICEGDIDYL